MGIKSIGDLLISLRALEQGKYRHKLYVESKIRKKFILEHNNRFTSRANVHEVEWSDVGDGIWQAEVTPVTHN